MKYYLKSVVIPFIYLFFTAFTAVGFLGIEKIAEPLRIIIFIINVLVLLFIVSAFAFKHGEQAYKDLLFNDVERRIMVEQNVVRPLKLHEEYKPWKGFVMGLLICVPLVLFLIPHSIIAISGGSYQGMGYIGSLLYYCFFIFIQYFSVELTVSSYFWMLLIIPIFALASGVPYLLGAKKARKVEEKILEQHKYIYGDK